MKATYLIVLMIACAALLPGAGYALPAQPAARQVSGGGPVKTSSDARGAGVAASQRQPNHAPEKGHARGHATVGVTATKQEQSSAPSGVATKDGIIQNEGRGNTRSLRTKSSPAAARLSPGAVRHRGTNPATIGRAANTASRNAGALDGGRMARKP